MTDDLLDAALARANRYNHASNCPCDPDRDPYVGCACGEIRREDLRRDVLALVERVREAEAGREQYSQLWQKASMSVLRLTDERDAARGKLDKVRQGLVDEIAKFEHGDSEEGWPVHNLRNVLAILDGEDAQNGTQERRTPSAAPRTTLA